MFKYIHNTTINNWKELKYLFIIRIHELWHIHALGYYTTVRLNELLSSDSRNKVHKHNADWWKPDVILVKVQKQAKQVSCVRSRAMNTREASAAWKETGSLKDTGYVPCAMIWFLAAQLCLVHENSWSWILMFMFQHIFYTSIKFSLKIFYRLHIVLQQCCNVSPHPKALYNLVQSPLSKIILLPLVKVSVQTSHY